MCRWEGWGGGGGKIPKGGRAGGGEIPRDLAPRGGEITGGAREIPGTLEFQVGRVAFDGTIYYIFVFDTIRSPKPCRRSLKFSKLIKLSR